MIAAQMDNDLQKAAAWSAQITKQLPFASAGALNDAAFDARGNALPGATRQSFDRPTPFIQKGWRVDRANKHNLEVTIGAENKRVRVIRRQRQGGPRVMTPYERRFGIGFLAPAKNMKLNQYGNVPLSAYKFIAQNLSTTDQGGFFIGQPVHSSLPVGVYRRSRERLFPQFISISRPSYSQRLPLGEIVMKVYERRYVRFLTTRLERAMATAR